jgi:2,3-dihydroxybenzoate decarboxylase
MVEALDLPFYLHPRNPLPSCSPIYEEHSWIVGPTWAFGAETAVHALRLIGSGLSDECPRLNIVIGHFGEGLPFYLWRIDNHKQVAQ